MKIQNFMILTVRLAAAMLAALLVPVIGTATRISFPLCEIKQRP